MRTEGASVQNQAKNVMFVKKKKKRTNISSLLADTYSKFSKSSLDKRDKA